MSPRRTMGAMLGEIAEGVLSAAAGSAVRATRVELDLPLEVVWTGGEFIADLPRLVTRTAFDAPPSRLRLVWELEP